LLGRNLRCHVMMFFMFDSGFFQNHASNIIGGF